jgi:hypothetical protein
MSGLKNTDRPQGAWTFVNFKDGALVAKINNEKKSFTDIEGTVQFMDVTDEEYEGKPYKKITLFIIDDEGAEYRLGFPLSSGYGNSFCCIAPNIRWNIPVNISGDIEMKNGKKYSKIFIKQPNENNKWVALKWYYTKDNDAGKKLPQGEEKSDRNGNYLDFTKRNAYFLKMLIDPKKSVFQLIKKAWPKFDPSKPKDKAVIPEAEDITAPIDDMPF